MECRSLKHPPPKKGNFDQIVDLEISKFFKRLRHKDITLQMDNTASDFLVKKDYDSAYRAWPMCLAVER